MINNTNNNSNCVTVLKVIKKGKKYQVITTIDELECLEEQLVQDRIFKGKNFTIEEWKEVKKHQEVTYYFSKVLNYLSYKLRTTKEVIEYLKEYNLDSCGSTTKGNCNKNKLKNSFCFFVKKVNNLTIIHKKFDFTMGHHFS